MANPQTKLNFFAITNELNEKDAGKVILEAALYPDDELGVEFEMLDSIGIREGDSKNVVVEKLRKALRKIDAGLTDTEELLDKMDPAHYVEGVEEELRQDEWTAECMASTKTPEQKIAEEDPLNALEAEEKFEAGMQEAENGGTESLYDQDQATKDLRRALAWVLNEEPA